MATLYVHGPHAGDWKKCAEEAGYSRTPPEDHNDIRRLIEQERRTAEGADSALSAIEGELSAEDYKRLADESMARLTRIASGLEVATSQEIQALKEILNRGHGKITAKSQVEDTNKPQPILVLPALGLGQEAQIDKTVCPSCGEVLYDPEART